ncbi:hypothetical protein NMG60_11036271 [Bertholletia excelsa]
MEPNTSPDSENETPPPASQSHSLPPKSVSFTNDALSSHHHRHHHHPAAVVTYRECLRNHAASIGGHAVDGCGEFMPSSSAATDPASLKCAACGCHRNFHRREDEPTTTASGATLFLEFHRQAPLPRRSSPSSSSSPPQPPSAQQMRLALGSAVPEDQGPPAPRVEKGENPNGRKRVRTKFSQEQKEKMLSFSEKLGWKMMKSDEELVEEFCNEIGVGKGVLKVWMHNNKNTFARRDTTKITSAANLNLNATSSGNGGMLNFDNGHSDNNAIHLHIPADASSPSA